MSSRSLAAARARRAGDAAPPVSGNRPGTSVGSAAAFSNMPPQPGNVRVASRQPMPQQQQQRPQSAAFQQIQQQSQNGLPFTKLSISDAIGLITLRLGRVEQWVIETEHETEGKDNSSTTTSGNAVDNSVLVSLLNRLETVEKRDLATGTGTASLSSDEVTKLTSDLASLNERYTKFCDEANKQTITIAKHTEQLFRFERELVETKDILKTFMIKYDNFVQESNEKLADYESAISEIEKSIAPTTTTFIDDISSILPQEQVSQDIINPDDLKSLVKQELAGIN
jgi:hypothetical protein